MSAAYPKQMHLLNRQQAVYTVNCVLTYARDGSMQRMASVCIHPPPDAMVLQPVTAVQCACRC